MDMCRPGDNCVSTGCIHISLVGQVSQQPGYLNSSFLSVISLFSHTFRLIIGVCLKSCKKSDSGSPELRLQGINQLDSITEETL